MVGFHHFTKGESLNDRLFELLPQILADVVSIGCVYQEFVSVTASNSKSLSFTLLSPSRSDETDLKQEPSGGVKVVILRGDRKTLTGTRIIRWVYNRSPGEWNSVSGHHWTGQFGSRKLSLSVSLPGSSRHNTVDSAAATASLMLIHKHISVARLEAPFFAQFQRLSESNSGACRPLHCCKPPSGDL